ncbi:MAG: TetR/AcrR family transcriptional regulator [Proteobacteria bacterium]|nr:TetR/AcrR family transcriptional regulator [Pseudomonadota bacterium]
MDSNTHSRQAVALSNTRGVKRRARILAAFHDCIISKGYAKTTLRDVARTAGMTASHLLYYFSGKDTLLEHYFDNVAQTIVKRIKSFVTEEPERQFELLADLFFAGKGITRSEIGFMLECFGVAVHDSQLRDQKTELDRFCKTYLSELFEQSPCGPSRAGAYAEISYAMLIGLRTAAYFDKRLGLPQARGLFYDEMLNLAGFSQRG